MRTRFFVSVFLLLMVFTIPLVNCSGEIDASTVATEVIGDDTFETTTQGTIKLADVDPMCADIDNSTGYLSAKTVLASFVENKTVYLDIDNKYKTDYSGTGNKTVCVVYVEYNSTHFQNVNAVMLKQKLLAVNDQDNDFNPENWTSFVKKEEIPEFSTNIVVVVFFLGLFTTTSLAVKKKLNSKSS